MRRSIGASQRGSPGLQRNVKLARVINLKNHFAGSLRQRDDCLKLGVQTQFFHSLMFRRQFCKAVKAKIEVSRNVGGAFRAAITPCWQAPWVSLVGEASHIQKTPTSITTRWLHLGQPITIEIYPCKLLLFDNWILPVEQRFQFSCRIRLPGADTH
jgi:hypothetical protein